MKKSLICRNLLKGRRSSCKSFSIETRHFTPMLRVAVRSRCYPVAVQSDVFRIPRRGTLCTSSSLGIPSLSVRMRALCVSSARLSRHPFFFEFNRIAMYLSPRGSQTSTPGTLPSLPSLHAGWRSRPPCRPFPLSAVFSLSE